MAAQGYTLRGKEKKQGEPYNYPDFLPEPFAHPNTGKGPQTKQSLTELKTQTLAPGEAQAEKLLERMSSHRVPLESLAMYKLDKYRVRRHEVHQSSATSRERKATAPGTKLSLQPTELGDLWILTFRVERPH